MALKGASLMRGAYGGSGVGWVCVDMLGTRCAVVAEGEAGLEAPACTPHTSQRAAGHGICVRVGAPCLRSNVWGNGGCDGDGVAMRPGCSGGSGGAANARVPSASPPSLHHLQLTRLICTL